MKTIIILSIILVIFGLIFYFKYKKNKKNNDIYPLW